MSNRNEYPFHTDDYAIHANRAHSRALKFQEWSDKRQQAKARTKFRNAPSSVFLKVAGIVSAIMAIIAAIN